MASNFCFVRIHWSLGMDCCKLMVILPTDQPWKVGKTPVAIHVFWLSKEYVTFGLMLVSTFVLACCCSIDTLSYPRKASIERWPVVFCITHTCIK